MNNIYFKNSIRFLFLIFFQLFILNRINFLGHINPFLYVLFIMSLPLNTPKWLLLLLGFFTGFVIDVFSDSIGLHIAATVLLAYLRPLIISILGLKQDMDLNLSPSIKIFGFRVYFFYASVLVIVHHFVLFYLEIFRFQDFFYTFYRALASSIFTLTLILIAQYLFMEKK